MNASVPQAAEASADQELYLYLNFTFTVEILPVVRSQRPPVVMQMPSAHRPSEQAPVNAVLLLQPLSTDSACQLLQNTPSGVYHVRWGCKALGSSRKSCYLSDAAASPGSSFFSSLCSSSSASRSSRWVVVVRDSRVHTVSCNVTEHCQRFCSLPLRVCRLVWLMRHILVNYRL